MNFWHQRIYVILKYAKNGIKGDVEFLSMQKKTEKKKRIFNINKCKAEFASKTIHFVLLIF